jgi:Bacterial Ig-like domain (group 1)
VDLSVSGHDAYGNTIAVSPAWSQAEPLGTLSAAGHFRAEKVGTTTMMAQSDSQSAAVQVTITPGKLAKLVVSPANATLQAGEVLPLQTTGRDAYENEVAVQPTWRVDNDIGEVSPSGEFTALRAQTGQVIAMTGGVSGSAQITVDPGPLAFLKVTPEDLRLTAGETGEIIAVGYDAFGNPVLTQPVWQITEGMGTLTPDGRLTAQKAGEGRVVVTLGHLAAVLPLQVERGEVAMLQIDPAATRVASGLQQQFTMQGVDRGGNQVPVTGTWEVQGNVGTIDTNGLFTASIAETGMVMGKVGPLMATAEVRIEPGQATSLRVTPETATLTAGEPRTLHSEAFDAAGNRVPTMPVWTVTEELGTVSGDGVFHPRRAGSGNIVATLGEVQQALQVSVQPAALATLTLSPAQLAIRAGDKAAFTAAGFDAYGNAVAIEPTWSLQGRIGQVEATTGTFQATTVGTGTVIAMVGTIAGLAPVSVTPGSAVRLQLDPPTTTLRAGETVSFTATAFDAYNNHTTAEIAWSLTAPLGELANGTLQVQRTGTTDIIASAGAIQARAMVQVQPGPVVRLQVIPQQATLPSGQTQQLRALGYDAYNNAGDIPVTWELTGEVGQLDAAGVLTAGKQGIGQITARLDGLTAQTEVAVVPGPVQRLLLTPGQTELAATTVQAFTVTGLDAGGNVGPVTVNWAMTEGLGSLDQEGHFTAAHVGEGTIVAYTDTLVGTAEVRVTPGPVALLFVTPQLATVRAGQTVQFQVQGFDAHHNPIPTLTPSWSAAGNIGLIDPQSGMFTATLRGLGKVQATLGGESGSADVIVQPSMPDTEQSRLVASRVTVLADGKTAADIIVLVRDRFGNPVTNTQVTLVSSRDDSIEQSGPSNQQGIAVGRIRSTKAGLSDITAVVESVRIGNSLRLTFNQPDVAG